MISGPMRELLAITPIAEVARATKCFRGAEPHSTATCVLSVSMSGETSVGATSSTVAPNSPDTVFRYRRELGRPRDERAGRYAAPLRTGRHLASVRCED